MACATLKRTLDWESLNQRPTKRRRCNPFGGNASQSETASTSRSQPVSGVDNSVSSNFTSQTTPSSRNRNVEKLQPPSAFSDATLSKISSDKMAQDIRDEIKRLHRRKKLGFSAAAIERMQDSESSGSEMGPDSPHRPDSPPNIVRNPERALFTFKQVQLICERMLKEREDEIREKYDDVLNTKLAEQYDAFVKFTFDQIQRRYEAAPSYLS